ncbi:MAG TPA: hypothetical protein VGK80_00400 [Rhodanobacteraceae bacterium]
MTAIAAMATVVMSVTIVLAVFALISRHSAVTAQAAAERRQKQAEGLVGFMLGDLNDKLDQVHRLDIMQAVDDKAMAYFDSLPAADATDAALMLRVDALKKIGNVRTEATGQLSAAIDSFQSAVNLARELVRRSPDDVHRSAVLGDSLNWLGSAYWQVGNLGSALLDFSEAAALLQKAHAANPDDNDLALELAQTQSNIGHIVEARGDLAGAQSEYESSLQLYRQLTARDPNNTNWQSYLGDGWDNLGKVGLERGRLDQAIAAYFSEHRIKAALAKDAGNHNAQAAFLVSNAILGRALAWCGDLETGLRYTEEAVGQAKALLAFDASSTDWQEDLALYSQQAGGLLRQQGKNDLAADANDDAVRIFESLLKKNPISGDFQREFSQTRLEQARLLISQGNAMAAKASAQSALDIMEKLRAKTPDDRSSLLLDAQAHLLLGQTASLFGDNTAAQREWTQARDLLQPALHAGGDPNFLAAYAEAVIRLDQIAAARPVIARLNAMGYRTPDLIALVASKHIDYPVNAEFQGRIARIMQGEATQAPGISTDVRTAVVKH